MHLRVAHGYEGITEGLATEIFLHRAQAVPGQLKPPTPLPLPLQLPFSSPLFTLPSLLPLELPALILPVREHTTGQAWAQKKRRAA